VLAGNSLAAYPTACTVTTGAMERRADRYRAPSLPTELMAVRGVLLTYEAVRYWCRKFGQAYANGPSESEATIDGKVIIRYT
jgi:hypothetical protein